MAPGVSGLPARCDKDEVALLVIDVQNDFCSPHGAHALRGHDVTAVHSAVARLRPLISAARQLSVPCVFIQTTHDDETDTPGWNARHPHETTRTCERGSWGADFYDVRPCTGDTVVEKHRYDAFVGTSLDETLNRLGKGSLLFSGVSTNVCVESTLRSAVCRDYLATIVEDCCADYTPESHHRGVASVVNGFGMAISSEALRAQWEMEPQP